MTVAELTQEMIRISKLLDKGVVALLEAAQEYAVADDAYRSAKAQAFLAAEGKTVAEKEATVDLVCNEQRLRQRIAEGRRMAAQEAVRARRSQLSALQSVCSAIRADMELSRYGPEVAA